MARREFDKATKRAALKRSGMLCEAVGPMYALPESRRCNATLEYGVEYDHIIADALGGEPTLENCAAVCCNCHRIKTAKHDTPVAAKVKRQSDAHRGIRLAPARTIQSAPSAITEKTLKRKTREQLPMPPRHSFYAARLSEKAKP